MKLWFEKLKKHYIFILCIVVIIFGFNLLFASDWMRSDLTEAETLGRLIKFGLRKVAGAILVVGSLLCLTLNRKYQKEKVYAEKETQ